VATAVRRELPRIAEAVDAIVKAFGAAGGSSTSARNQRPSSRAGRRGVPATFGTKRAWSTQSSRAEAKRFNALWKARKIQPWRRRAICHALDFRSATSSWDCSQRHNPYVLSTLKFAKRRGAITVGVTSNSDSPLARQAQIAIVPDTGPKSSPARPLKAGTAQKMVLNLLSTAAMVRVGRVYEGWMVYVALANSKLRSRGVQILRKRQE